jgi:hypothetical protein
MSRHHSNNSVILVDVGTGFRPRDERCTPRHFTGAKPFKSSLQLRRAIACALQFNRQQMDAIAFGQFDGRWAQVVFSLVQPAGQNGAMTVEEQFAGAREDVRSTQSAKGVAP